MKITLINPPFIFPRKEEFIFSQCLGLRSLSSFLKAEGRHEVHFIDALRFGFSNIKKYASGYIVGLDIEDIIKMIPSTTDLIGVSAPFSQIAPVVHDLIEQIKLKFPNTLVVMGGVYPSTQPRLALKSKADLIVVGEGEIAIKEIADGKNPKEILGVYSHDSFNNERFPSARIVEDLDDLPLLDYSIPSMEKYFIISPRREKGCIASIITSRGCPFNCEFCSIHPIYGRKYRYRSATNVLEEIKFLVKRFGIRTLEIEDDNFTLRKRRTIEILEGIIYLNENNAHLNWRTPNGVKIDTLDEEVISLIKRSNCSEIVLALEHGDSEMLKIMDKDIDLDKAFHIIEMFIKYKIPRLSFFVIVGYPGETKERFIKGLNYLKKIRRLGGNTSLCVNIAQPYPGTRLLDRCFKEGYISDPEFDNFLIRRDLMSTGHTIWITTPDFDKEEVLRRKALLEECFDNTPKWRKMIKGFLPEPAINIIKAIRSSLLR